MTVLEGQARSATSETALGVPGYVFGHLHDPERLASLYERFCEEVQATDRALWHHWEAYRSAPDAPPPPIPLSHLLVAMARHLSRFVARLFHLQSSVDAVTATTRDQDDLFRFKVDFVRRRVLPLVKRDPHVVSTPDDEALVARLIAEMAEASAGSHDQELAIARAGCAMMDRERAGGGTVAAQVDRFKRWCAARLHDRAYRGWVIFRFPEVLDYWRLVDVQRPRPDLPELMVGPDDRLRRRDGFRLTDARMAPREVLNEISYCVLCHERDKDSCSKGLLQPGRKPPDVNRATRWPHSGDLSRPSRPASCGGSFTAVPMPSRVRSKLLVIGPLTMSASFRTGTCLLRRWNTSAIPRVPFGGMRRSPRGFVRLAGWPNTGPVLQGALRLDLLRHETRP